MLAALRLAGGNAGVNAGRAGSSLEFLGLVAIRITGELLADGLGVGGTVAALEGSDITVVAVDTDHVTLATADLCVLDDDLASLAVVLAVTA